MKYRFEQLDACDPKHLEAVDRVAGWSIDRVTMKLYTPEEIKHHPLGVVAFSAAEDLAGHVAVTEIDKINGGLYGRIGALSVAEDIQGNGVSKDLIKHLLSLAIEELPDINGFYAFANQRSLNSFLSNNARIVGVRDPQFPTGCNTIVAINPNTGTSHGEA